MLPNGRIGAQQPSPTTAAGVHATYKHGVGLLELDLTEVTDPTALLGRTIVLDNGIGQTKVIVPEGLNVEIDSSSSSVRSRCSAARRTAPTTRSARPATGTGRALTIKIDQNIGNVEVIRS